MITHLVSIIKLLGCVHLNYIISFYSLCYYLIQLDFFVRRSHIILFDASFFFFLPFCTLHTIFHDSRFSRFLSVPFSSNLVSCSSYSLATQILFNLISNRNTDSLTNKLKRCRTKFITTKEKSMLLLSSCPIQFQYAIDVVVFQLFLQGICRLELLSQLFSSSKFKIHMLKLLYEMVWGRGGVNGGSVKTMKLAFKTLRQIGVHTHSR